MHTVELYKQYNPILACLPTIDISPQFYFYHKHKLPEDFRECFTLNLSVHNYTTRTRYDLHLPSPYSSIRKKLSSLKEVNYGMNSLLN